MESQNLKCAGGLPQNRKLRLWFTDKYSGERAEVTAVSIGNGRLLFHYRGRQYTFPREMLGKRIFVCSEEKKSSKEHAAEIFYSGIYYRFENGKWKSGNKTIPLERFQYRLSAAYRQRHRYYSVSVKKLVEHANRQGRSIPEIRAAIVSLEVAFLHASAKEARWFLPKLSSLYRMTSNSSASVAMYRTAVAKYGSAVSSPALMTTVAAAYMDIGNIKAADSLKYRALKMTGGNNPKTLNFAGRFYGETRFMLPD